MSSEIVFPPMSVQNAEIASANSSTNLYNFLMGCYTTVYLGTLYLYLTRKSPQRLTVIITVTILYLIGLTQFAVQWWLGQYNSNLISMGAQATFIGLFVSPAWTHITIDVTSFLMFVVADGLLIWRCYNVWGRSYRVILLPSFLLLVEVVNGLSLNLITALSLSSIIFILAVHSNPEGSQVTVVNDLQSSVFFVSFATSLTTTVLVAYRIYSSARNISDISFSASISRRFIHIIEIIVQSAAIYSAVLLIAAISGVLPVTNGDFPSESDWALNSYSFSLLVPTAGIAPTIMAARVSLASTANADHIDVISRFRVDTALSNLEFERDGGRSTNINDTSTHLREARHDPHYTEQKAAALV